MKCFVIGNGPSLSPALLESLNAPAFAVNRIWKIFHVTKWRPAFYVRAEVPTYNPLEVREDLYEMGKVGCTMYLQKGFIGSLPPLLHPKTERIIFETCDGEHPHDWHLPQVCGYGTVVHVAMQLAVLAGFTEIELIGCDLGNKHFYDEPFSGDALARRAHEIARKCCPVPIIWKERNFDGKQKEIYWSNYTGYSAGAGN